jgi:serine/threonine protein kinase
MIGTFLDNRYCILRKLGEGAMGEVYLAEHVNLGRKEALKIIQPAHAGNPEFVARFRREARATNRVQHPNIVSVYDFRQLPDGRLLLCMEYADGVGVDSILSQKRGMPLPRAVHVLHQLADAVAHAHACGVVHRDLKPENLILVEHRGRPDVLKVLDFGIAKIVAEDYQSKGLTPMGETLGTPAYMAPEQFSGTATDPRSDIYAIGCVAYELITGEPPFTGRTMEIMHAHVTEPPRPPSQRCPAAGIPPELDEVVLRCLIKDPNERYQTGHEVRAALERVPGTSLAALRPRPITTRPRHYEEEEQTLQEARRSSLRITPIRATEPPPESERGPRNDCVLELGETLLDLDHEDARLVLGLARLHELEQDMERHLSELEGVERHIEALEQAARGREAALRFALSELEFERPQAPAHAQEIAAEVAAMRARLAQIPIDLEREVGQQIDRSIALTVKRATLEEVLQQRFAAMEALVVGLAQGYRANPTVEHLLQRLLRATDEPRGKRSARLT